MGLRAKPAASIQVIHGRVNLHLAQAPLASQPGEGPLHHPSPVQHLKGMLVSRFQPPMCCAHSIPSIGPISPNALQTGEAAQESLQHQLCPIPVLDIGGVHRHSQQQTLGHPPRYVVCGHFLASVVTPRPPFSVVFTDWLSITGCRFPARCLTTRTRIMNLLPGLLPAPNPEIMVGLLPR